MPRRLTLALALLLAASPAARAGDDKPDGKKPTPAKKTGPQPAKIFVRIPAAATLTIDGNATAQTGDRRTVLTPPLAPGRPFRYTLKATYIDGDRKIVRMAVARVEAGKETVIDLRPGSLDGSSSQIVYVPTPQRVVDRMLQMAKVTRDDVVFDLGCGDGRVVVTAAKKYGARGVGVDIDPKRVEESKANVARAGVGKRVEVREGDALRVPDLARATVVMTYMLPEFMDKLKPILLKQLKPGTRIVAHDYALPGWPPEDTVTIAAPARLFAHTLYLWTVPQRKKPADVD